MAQKQRIGKDLRLQFVELGADLSPTVKGDLDIVENEDNLLQAITIRLCTDEGELYDIGHADYGSRLFEAVGEINNEATRKRIELIVRECLSQEPRIKEVVNVSVLTNKADLQRVDIEITVLPIESNQYVTLLYPFSLEG